MSVTHNTGRRFILSLLIQVPIPARTFSIYVVVESLLRINIATVALIRVNDCPT